MNQTVPTPGLAGSAMPCASVVMPTYPNPPVGAGPVSVAACQAPLPAGRTSMPRPVARTSVPSGVAATHVARPRPGAAPAFCQVTPPSADVKTCLACWVPGTMEDAQTRTRFAVFAAASSAPVGWPSVSGGPTGHGMRATGCQGALPFTEPFTEPFTGPFTGPE